MAKENTPFSTSQITHGRPNTNKMELYPCGVISMAAAKQGNNRFSLLYRSGLEPRLRSPKRQMILPSTDECALEHLPDFLFYQSPKRYTSMKAQ